MFVDLLNSTNVEVVEQAIWGLGNIAGDNPKIRDMVINSNAVEPITQLLDKSKP